MGDPKYKMKIVLSAVGAALCLSALAVFLPLDFRRFAWGLALGLVLIPAGIVARSLFGSDSPLKPEDVRRRLQSKSLRVVYLGAVPLGFILLFFIFQLSDNIQTIVIGAVTGFLAMVAVLIGPALMAAHRASVIRERRVVYPTEVSPDTGAASASSPQAPPSPLADD